MRERREGADDRRTGAMANSKPRIRDADATEARILSAAKAVFAEKGLGGARVDEISRKAAANKRMIYYYFGSKEGLFRRVVEEAYLDIRKAEQELAVDHLGPREALEALIRFTWSYYLENPEFISLVNSENLHKAKHMEHGGTLTVAMRTLVGMVGTILRRGVAEGVFRPSVDPVQLNITIAAIGYYYLTNRYTGAILFERDFMEPAALEDRLKFNIETVMRLVANTPDDTAKAGS